jgi:hypothetical protein
MILRGKKPTFFLLLFFCGFNFLAQGGFKKAYFLQGSLSSTSRDVIESPDGKLIIIGNTNENVDGKISNRLTIIATNGIGNQIWRKSYGNSKFNYLYDAAASRGAISDSSGVYYVSPVKDSVNANYIVLIKFGFNGDTIWQRTYKHPIYDIYASAVSKTIDGGLLICGFLAKNNVSTRPLFLLKTKFDGTVLWFKEIISPNSSSPSWVANRAVQDTVTKKIIVAGWQYNGPGVIQSLILITDSLGNKLSQSSLSGPYGGVFADLIQTNDKNFVAVGTKQEATYIDNFPLVTAYAIKFDLNSSLFWAKEYGTPSLGNQIATVYERKNGDLILGCSIDTMALVNLGYGIFTRVIRTNALGNVIWSKDIKNIDATYAGYEYLQSVNPTRDGGFALTTWFPYDPTNPPYRLIKLDSNFCDTTEAYCKSLYTSITAFTKRTGWSFAVFPNPANNMVHVKIDAPTDKTFSLKLTEVTGRTIDEINLKAGTEFELNTTAYAPGVYMVEILYQGAMVETKRLMITR